MTTRENSHLGMLAKASLSFALAIGLSAFAVQPSKAQDQFSYDCETCPTNWGNLDNDPDDTDDTPFETCRLGEAQSPIDISKVKKRRLPRLRFDYQETDLEGVNTVVNIELEDPEGGNEVRVGGKAFTLLQFHLHSKSEHFLFGEQFALEIHLVHRADDGSLAVIGRFIKAANEPFDEFDEVIEVLKEDASEVENFDLNSLIPRNQQTYRYVGSTTTPGCVEDVQWVLFKTPLRLSGEQITEIRAALRGLNNGFDNFRPIQSRNGREILTDVRK